MTVIKFRRQQTLEEMLAKRQAKEFLYGWVEKSSDQFDDIECPDEYWGMIIYSFLRFCENDINAKVTTRSVKAFMKKKWELKDQIVD